jgi:hypothetical protein
LLCIPGDGFSSVFYLAVHGLAAGGELGLVEVLGQVVEHHPAPLLNVPPQLVSLAYPLTGEDKGKVFISSLMDENRARILKNILKLQLKRFQIALGKVNFSNGILKQPDFSFTAVCHCGQETYS